MKKLLFKGCGTAIATPFTKDGVNFEEFGKLIEDQIRDSIDALIVCGTTGEASTMTTEEKKQTIAYAVKKVAGRVPVIAGTGGNCTASVIEMSKWAKSIGVDGLLVVTPYYNKTTQAGLVAHYEAIANSVTLPIILYSVPSRTGVNITPETCLALSKIPNIVAIKEASGNISQVAKIASLCQDELAIYSGNDDQVLPLLSLGGVGVISVLSNLYPQFVHDMVMDYFAGNFEKSKNAQLEALELIDALFCEVNPIPVKAGLNMRGYNFGTPRLPLVPLSEKGSKMLQTAISNFEKTHA